MSHVSEDGEDGEPREDARGTVDNAHDDGVLVTVVVKAVVGGQGRHSAPRDGQREEDL